MRLGAWAVAAIVFASVSGCGRAPLAPEDPTWDRLWVVQQRSVVSKNLKPDVMVLFDRSDAMGVPIDPTATACTPGCNGTSCPAGCATRLSEVVSALTGFFAQHGTSARYGLATFPGPGTDVCTATSQVLVPFASPNDVDAELTATAGEISTQLSKLTTGGSAPIATSLQFLAGLPSLTDQSRDDFVMLITASLPACSGATTANETVAQLNAKGIRTIVIGFGPDVATGDGAATLNSMAAAGSFAHQCPKGTDAECGVNDHCNATNKLCDRKFTLALTAADLTTYLEGLVNEPVHGDPCHFTLETPPQSPALLQVRIDGVVAAPDEAGAGWDYATGGVTFKGSLCSRLANALPSTPVLVEFATLRGL